MVVVIVVVVDDDGPWSQLSDGDGGGRNVPNKS